MYNRIPVFYYHSISPAKSNSWYKSFLTIELSYFEDLLKYLVSKKYEFLSLDEYFIRRTDSSSKNKRMICLTFDDGYLDNYVYVYPLLKKYQAKGTIFVSPLYVQDNLYLRPTLEDVWNKKIKYDDLESMGFMSWKEMQLLEQSGIIDIQSHTLTHTKYYSSDQIREFHHPKADYLYAIGNIFPERLPYYMTDSDFINLISYGTPFFEETSSVICKRVFINQNFVEECKDILKGYDWNQYNFEDCISKTKHIYEYYKSQDNLIVHRENEEEYYNRVTYEIAESKTILEERLGKSVNHICWPHGDYNEFCHEIALKSGYKSSHIVINKLGEINTHPNKFDRTGSSIVIQNRLLSLWKAKYKIGSYQNQIPYSWIKGIYTLLRYGKK